MATNFPTSIDSYTTKVNNVDTIDAANVNDLQDATVAVETLLGAGSTRRTSWTPTVAFSVSSTGLAYTSSGFYARFGSLVYVQGEFVITENGTGSGDLRVTNLPVASLTNAGCSLPCSLHNSTWTTTQPMVARTASGASSTVIDFYSLSGVTWTRIAFANVADGSGCRFSGFYFHA
jgi:hypothetical protein